MKKRILWVGEATYLSTGYSTYGHELLTRLHATGKYDICELAAYGDTSDPRDQRWRSVPWKFIPVYPNRANQREVDHYHSNHIFQFGSLKFEEACLQHKATACLDVRDKWMLAFEETSPFRRFYNWTIMPTVDAEPQDDDWLATFMHADGVFTYSDWGQEVLRKQSQGQIKLLGTASPGANLADFPFRTNKRQHKKAMGIDPDCLVVGTVMRNQKRKLYPDLIDAFAEFLKKAPKELADRTFLYMHTAYPDVGWKLTRLMLNAGISNKCVFTYWCNACGAVFPGFFQDARAFCHRCGKFSAQFPNSHHGIEKRMLGEIVNLFDVYVQYASSEGFAIPLVEAAACGVPVMATDYSAMSDVVRKLEGMPIKVQRLTYESETHCKRALPDNDDFVDQLANFLQKPDGVRARMGYDARKAVERHYNWDETAARWMARFDSLEDKPLSDTWASPAHLHKPITQVPPNLSNEQFVRWGIVHVAGRPDLVNSFMALRMVRDLNWEITLDSGMTGIYYSDNSTLGVQQKTLPFNREAAMRMFMQMCDHNNFWEKRRVSQ